MTNFQICEHRSNLKIERWPSLPHPECRLLPTPPKQRGREHPQGGEGNTDQERVLPPHHHRLGIHAACGCPSDQIWRNYPVLSHVSDFETVNLLYNLRPPPKIANVTATASVCLPAFQIIPFSVSRTPEFVFKEKLHTRNSGSALVRGPLYKTRWAESSFCQHPFRSWEGERSERKARNIPFEVFKRKCFPSQSLLGR